MITFTVSYARVNEREATQGGTTRHGFIDQDVSLHGALAAVRDNTPAASERISVWASDSEPHTSRWVSVENEEYETGDNVTLSVHFPRNTTAASRARLVRLLQVTL